MDSAIDVLLPKTKKIRLCGQAIVLRPLTLKQLYAAFEILKTKKADISAPAGTSDDVMLLRYFAAAGDALPDLAAAITGLPAEQITENSLEDISELALGLSEVNNFAKIFSNFQKAMELANPKANQ